MFYQVKNLKVKLEFRQVDFQQQKVNRFPIQSLIIDLEGHLIQKEARWLYIRILGVIMK